MWLLLSLLPREGRIHTRQEGEQRAADDDERDTTGTSDYEEHGLLPWGEFPISR